MQVDAFGKIEPCKSVIINDVKADNDLSALVYDNFNARKRYGQRNYNQGNSYNHGNNYNYGNNYNQGQFNENKSYQTYSVNDSQSVGTFLSSQI